MFVALLSVHEDETVTGSSTGPDRSKEKTSKPLHGTPRPKKSKGEQP
jgi:hypothetical protein